MDRKKPIDGLFSPIERPSRARWVRDGRMSRADDGRMSRADDRGVVLSRLTRWPDHVCRGGRERRRMPLRRARWGLACLRGPWGPGRSPASTAPRAMQWTAGRYPRLTERASGSCRFGRAPTLAQFGVAATGADTQGARMAGARSTFRYRPQGRDMLSPSFLRGGASSSSVMVACALRASEVRRCTSQEYSTVEGSICP